MYLDDVMTFWEDFEKTWEVAIWVMGKLTAAGFMINKKNWDAL